MDLLINRTRIYVVSGEPNLQNEDALIHPTNNFLWFSSGFSEQLKRLGGESLEREAIAMGPIKVGEAMATKPGRLNCRMIIHAAAWGQDMMTNAGLIHQAVRAALDLASKNNCLSITIPTVGANVGRFPLIRAVEATFLTLIEHCLKETALREIHFLAEDYSVETILNGLIQSALSAMPPDEGANHKEV